jgi:hypothetical protein
MLLGEVLRGERLKAGDPSDARLPGRQGAFPSQAAQKAEESAGRSWRGGTTVDSRSGDSIRRNLEPESSDLLNQGRSPSIEERGE